MYLTEGSPTIIPRASIFCSFERKQNILLFPEQQLSSTNNGHGIENDYQLKMTYEKDEWTGIARST